MFVHGARGGKCSVSPDHIKKALARDRLAGGNRQQMEHAEFFGSEMHDCAAAERTLLDEVDFDVAQGEPLHLTALLRGATQQCADAGEQFVPGEWLHEKVIRARVQPPNSVFDAS